jgi:hypothetical protein
LWPSLLIICCLWSPMELNCCSSRLRWRAQHKYIMKGLVKKGRRLAIVIVFANRIVAVVP